MDDLNRQIAFMIGEKRIERLVREREKVALRPLPEPQSNPQQRIVRMLLSRRPWGGF